MNLYVAPLEGITGFIFRNVFHSCFGSGATKYYTPFLSLCTKKGITDKEKAEVAPENNQAYQLVPQVMTVIPKEFMAAKATLRWLGYKEINLNLGCPSRTVTSRGRGAGALGDLARLQGFLDEIFQDGDPDISIKTRIGIEHPEEFFQIMELYNQYPIKELTIHPRTMKELYKGTPHRDGFMEALGMAKMPVCYNGDINSLEDYLELTRQVQESGQAVSGVMLGRGILRNPALIRQIRGYLAEENAAGQQAAVEKLAAANGEVLVMLSELQAAYTQRFSGQTPVLYKLKEIWAYLGQGLYQDQGKLVKKIMKCKSLPEYEGYMRQILAKE